MSRIIKVSALGALLAAVLTYAGTAVGATGPSVFVRVEGAGATLLAQTLTQTTTAKQVKGKLCPGASAGGALNDATAGNWRGAYSIKFKDYLIGSILGETPSGNDFWSLWINGRSSSTGACSTPLHMGDHELWFHCVADASFNCTNDPLALKLPAVVGLGRAVNGAVTQLDGAGHATATAGASVSGGGLTGVSGVGGGVRLIARRSGVIELQARKSGATPSDPVSLCVFVHKRSECRAALAGPVVHIDAIRAHEVFSKGPRRLHGSAVPDAAGLTDVSFSLLRHAPTGSCSYFDSNRGAWHTTRCAAKPPRFSIGASASWSYLLPAPLSPGRYRLTVAATDANGHKGSVAREFEVRR